jgi:tetraacyldisaccharide 4'-kinase
MEKLRVVVKEIAYTQNHAKLTPLQRSLFIPVLSFASSLYRIALSLRHSLYRFRLFRNHR